MSDMVSDKERIERLINRRLDGELTEQEALELDRMLIRSPEHRQMLERSAHLDALCGDAIREALTSSSPTAGREAYVMTGRAGQSRSIWWLAPTALAACLAWIVFGGGWRIDSGDTPGGFVERVPNDNAVDLRDYQDPPDEYLAPLNSSPYRQVSTGGRGITNGRRDTKYYSVVGKDGNLYLIELDRLRAVRTPTSRDRERVPLGEL